MVNSNLKHLRRQLIHYPRVLFLCLTIAGFLIVSGSAKAKSVELEYTLGFDGVFQLGKWTPITVTLENRGRMIQGTLEVMLSSGSEFGKNIQHHEYRQAVELPYNSKKKFTFTVLIKSYVHPLIIRLRQSDDSVISEEINLRKHYLEKTLVVVTGGNISMESFGQLPTSVQSVAVRQTVLPEEWFGYDGVTMLMMSVTDLARLHDRKYLALLNWLKQGGYLVLSSQLNYGAFRQKRIQQLMPVQVFGLRSIKQMDALEKYCGVPIQSPGPTMILKSKVDNVEVIVAEKGVPLVLSRSIGDGQIVTLMFDHQQAAFKNWQGIQSLWKNLFNLRIKPPKLQRDSRRQSIQEFFLSEIPLRFPRFLFVSFFLIIYFIGLKLLIVRFQSDRQRWPGNMAGLAVFIVVFSVGSFFWIYKGLSRTNSAYNSFSYLMMFDRQPMLLGRAVIGIHSLKNDSFNLEFGTQPYAVELINNDQEKNSKYPRLISQQNQSGRTITIPIERWARRFFQIDFIREFPLKAEARLGEEGLIVTLENATPDDLIGCRLMFNGRLLNYGRLAAGEKLVKRFSPASYLEKPPLDEAVIESFKSIRAPEATASLFAKLKHLMQRDLIYSIRERHNNSTDSIHFLGWIESSGMTENFVIPGINGESVSVIEMSIPVMKKSEI